MEQIFLKEIQHNHKTNPLEDLAANLSKISPGKIKAARATKKKKGKIITGHIKATGAGSECFMDWLNPTASELAEERKEDISSLVIGFAARMRKRGLSA